MKKKDAPTAVPTGCMYFLFHDPVGGQEPCLYKVCNEEFEKLVRWHRKLEGEDDYSYIKNPFYKPVDKDKQLIPYVEIQRT